MAKKKQVPVLVASLIKEAGKPSLNGLKVEVKRPEAAAKALEMLALGKGVDEIRETTGLGWDAIKGLRARHSVGLEVRRQQLAEDGWEMAEGLRLLAMKKMKQLSEDDEQLAKTSLKDLIQARSWEQERALENLGEVRAVVEHRSGKPSLADAMKAIAEARASLQKEAIVVEVEKVDSTQ